MSAFALRGLLATSRRSGLAKANCEASPRDSRIRTRNASCPPVQGGADTLIAQWVTRVTVFMHYRELASLSPRSEDYTEPCVLFFLVLFCCGIHSYCTVLTPPSSPLAARTVYGPWHRAATGAPQVTPHAPYIVLLEPGVSRAPNSAQDTLLCPSRPYPRVVTLVGFERRYHSA